MFNKVEFIHKKLRNSLNKKGYLNINHIQVEGKSKLAEISHLFKCPDYQTFRLLYMRDNQIVGEEIINTKILNGKRTSLFNDIGLKRSEKCIYKIRDKMKLIKANQYLLIHTTPLEQLQVSRQLLDTTSYFYTYLNGFMGHLIINSKSYAWIDIYKNNIYITNRQIKGKSRVRKKHIRLHNMSIKSRKNIINLVSELLTNNNHSIIAITKWGQIPDTLIDISNEYINSKNNKIQEYLNSLKELYKNSKIILITDDGNTFKESINLLINNVLDNSIWYTELNGNLYMYNTPNIEEYKNSIRRNKIERKK